MHVLYERDITPQPAQPGTARQPDTVKGNQAAGSAPQRTIGAGIAAVALAPKLPPAPAGANLALTPENENAVRAAVSEASTGGAEAGTATTVEVSAGTAGAEVAAGATVIGAIIIVSGVQMFLAGRYQEKLRDAGYILLEDPLKICIGGCHLPTRPAPSIPDLTTLHEPLSPTEFFSPLPTTVTPPVPAPKPKPEERRRRRKCMPGASCPTWQPRLRTKNEYWNLAYQYRKAHDMLAREDFNQNIAVLLLDAESPIIEKNGQGLHSEQQILWSLAERAIDFGCPILGLFSERKPCQEICQKLVLPQLCRENSRVPFDVYFAIDYYNSPGGMKSENNRSELIKSYAQAG